MATTNNKVTFGLSNVHVFPVSSETGGKITYDTGFPIPGAVSMSLKPEGASDPFYADNMAYYVSATNNGYSGSLEMALMPDDFLIKILGYTVDTTSGNLIENIQAKNKPFALGFEFDGDDHAVRHIIYYCKAKRPNMEGNTTADKTTPKGQSIDFTATARTDNGNVKAKCEKGSSAYDEFFTKPFEPVPPKP